VPESAFVCSDPAVARGRLPLANSATILEKTMDAELLLKVMDQLTRKIDEVAHSTSDLKSEVSAIKTRLFNGLTETTRETYAKVIILENKQEESDVRLHQIQKTWLEKFTAHDTKERMYHSLVGTVMAFLVTVFSALLVFEVEKYHLLTALAAGDPPGAALPNPGVGVEPLPHTP
jgi:hypothetical protein